MAREPALKIHARTVTNDNRVVNIAIDMSSTQEPPLHSREAAFVRLGGAVRQLFHQLRAVAEAASPAQEGFTVSHRAVLESLATHGAQTVPALARARPVARQHIQVLVNDLVDWGLVETRSNPAHKRSRLVALTVLGTKRFDSIRRAEARVLESLHLSMSATKLGRLADGLDTLSSDLAQWLAERPRRGNAEP